jgi:hypothetical protein
MPAVSCRGSINIVRQRIQVGIGYAGRTVTVEEADTRFRVYDGDQLLTEVLRTTANANRRTGSTPSWHGRCMHAAASRSCVPRKGNSDEYH